MEYCVCGHRLGKHIVDQDMNYFEFCEDCMFDIKVSDDKYHHIFKLDNLKLIEDLAKEKGLV